MGEAEEGELMKSLNAKYLHLHLRDAGAVELRTLPDARSQWFTDAYDLLAAADAAEQRGQDVYMSLNRPLDGQPREAALREHDVERIIRLPMDFDAVRPAGTSASDHQIALAEAARLRATNRLRALRWPDPVLVHSGNGVHAIYRAHLPATGETKSQVTRVYQALGERYSDGQVLFDRTVRNPSRILRLPGTFNVKAGRRSRITSVPPVYDTVTSEMLRWALESIELPSNVVAFRRPVRRMVTGKGDYATLDIVAWFKSHGLYVHELGGDKHGVLCPWVSEHTTPTTGSDTVIWTRGDAGWPTFYCAHAHCDGRGLLDVIEHLGGADAFCTRTWRGEQR
jgi:hypothetical protein